MTCKYNDSQGNAFLGPVENQNGCEIQTCEFQTTLVLHSPVHQLHTDLQFPDSQLVEQVKKLKLKKKLKKKTAAC